MKKRENGLTLEDMAKLCDVSTSTVSRVLNNEPGISQETRERVQKIAGEHKFMLQKRKRPLARSQLTLVIVIPDEAEMAVNPFYNISELLNAINSVFADEKKTIEIISISDYIKSVESRELSKVDGTILAFSTIDSDIKQYLKSNNIPYIFLNRILENENYISCNNFRGMVHLGEYLASRGHSRIGYLGYRKIPINKDRYRGYSVVCLEQMGTVNEKLITSVDSIEEVTAETARFFIKNKCDAVMCFNDNFAVRLINEMQILGKKVPGDISVTGFDNTPMRKLFKPEITTVNLSTYDMGFFAARWLRENILRKECREIRMEIDGHFIQGATVK
ncbi:MAG: LacI family transcriptional regulator [bacterium]|nr:LacI family transcriptional regulator [bacterium]